MSSNELIERLVVDASSDPLNPEKNFWIAAEYEKLGQTASAVSFYLRAAEYGVSTHPLIAYNSLLRISICIDGQNNRNLTVTNVLLQAIAYLPNRPEAYFLYSKFHSRQKNWQEAYTFAQLGLLSSIVEDDLLLSIGYPGQCGLLFEKAFSAWWIGRKEESKKIFLKLSNDKNLNEEYSSLVQNNLEKM